MVSADGLDSTYMQMRTILLRLAQLQLSEPFWLKTSLHRLFKRSLTSIIFRMNLNAIAITDCCDKLLTHYTASISVHGALL